MEITRVFEILDYANEHLSRMDAVAGKEDGQWITYSTSEFVRLANQVSYGLLAMGFQKGDKVVTASNNRPEWNFLDVGMMQIGVVNVPIYPTLSEDETLYILNHSDARMVVVSDSGLFKKFSNVLPKAPKVDKIFTFNDIEGAVSYREILTQGEKNEIKLKTKLQEVKDSIHTEDLFTIIYTSGTTGVSKGVMLSHKNICTNLNDALYLLPLESSDRVLSFLPLCHVFERTVHYAYMLKGYGIYYAENMGTIVQDVKELQVGGFVSVPRLLEVMYDKILAKGKALKGIKKQIFFWAVNVGQKFEHGGVNGAFYEFKLKIARALVFSKWQEGLGGRIQMIISGGAALQPRLARIFTAAGMTVQEGYGLTETSPVVAANEPAYPNNRIGTVGIMVRSVEVKIAQDGEILVKGPSVMMGYYKNEEITREVIDEDGWFHTGDIGELIEGRFLKITDRKKEIFKNSAGKYISPQMIENKCKESFFIENAMVVGENQKFTSALIAPNFRFLHDYCARKGIHYRDNEELVTKPEVLARYQQELNVTNKQLSPHEQIKRFRLVCDEWSAATGELTATLKLKRRVLDEKYAPLIKEIFSISKSGDV